MFGYYASAFTTVEINYTFYRMPTPKMTDGVAWRRRREGFTYTLKAPQRITHDKRLKDCERARAVLLRERARARAAPRAAAVSAAAELQVRSRRGSRRSWRWLPARPARRVRVPPRLLADRRGLRAAAASTASRSASPTSATRRRRSRATARHGYFRLRDEGYTPADLERWAERDRATSAPTGTTCSCTSSTKRKGKGRSSRARSSRS